MKLRLLAIVAVLALLPAAAYPDYSDIQRTQLDNGLTILTREVRVAPVVSVNVFYKVGSRNEHTGITGVSHLLEHLLFKGTEKYPKGQFERLIRERGGINNAGTWTDFTYYWELIQSDYLEMALQLEADRMRGALIKAEDHVSEMVVVRSELEGRENSPDSLVWDLVNSLAFQAHPYRWPIIGWRSDVEGMTRDEIYRYYRSYYGPNNATVVLVGDFETEQAVELVKKCFGGIQPIDPPPAVRTAEPEQKGERRGVLRLAGNAQRTLMAWHIPEGTHPDVYALDMLDQILSGGRSSRLHQALVESGIATGAWSYAGSKTDPSLFYVGATAQQGKSNDDLESTLLAEIRRLQESPPTAEEMSRARRQIEAAFVFSADDVRSQAELIGRFELTVGLDRLPGYLSAINQVTPEQVVEAAKKYFVDEKRTVAWFTPTAPAPGGDRPGVPGAPAHLSEPAVHPDAPAPYNTAAVPPAQAGANAPEQSSSPAGGLPEPVRYELENGIVLIVLNNPANPSISISGSFSAGSWSLKADQRPLAGFAADMLERGTRSRTSQEFARDVDALGASISFRAGVEAMWIDGRCLSRDFEQYMRLTVDALRNPAFPPDEIEKLQSESLSRLQQAEESPDAVAMRAFMNMIYPRDHPFHSSTIEQEQNSIRAISQPDLQRFHERHYGPKGTILSVVGDITPEECRRVVESMLGDWRAQADTRPVDIPDVAPGQGSQKFIAIPDKTEATVIYGWPAKLRRTSDGYYAAVVMNDVLGGGSVLTSRLGKAIRGEMGLVYDVNSGFRATLGAGPWLASLATNPENAEKAVTELKRVVGEMAARGPDDDEVTESTRFITGVLSLRLATNSGIASFLQSAEFYNLGMDYLAEFRQLYGNVTQQEANDAARKYLRPESATLVVVGPETTTGYGTANH